MTVPSRNKPRVGILTQRTVLLALAVMAGCGTGHDSAQKAPETRPAISGLGLETVAVTAMPETVDVVGTVRARTSALVSTRIPGVVSVLKVREGDRVRKGQILMQLDAQENQALAAQSASGIDEARRALDEAVARRKLADATFERYHRLFTEQAVSRQEFDVRQTDRELAAQGVARAEARLKQAQEGARAASAMADYTRVIAPISGIITSKQVDLGATVFPSQPLMTIEDESHYQLELAIPETLAQKIRPGMPVRVSLDASGTTAQTRIAEVVPAADPASRTFIAKIDLNQKGIRSGMFGRGVVSLGSTVNAMLVPRSAVLEKGALTSVWVVGAGQTTRLRLVRVGKTVGDRVEILSGLAAGDRVVVSGLEKVSEGAKVE